jgi:hypothetical protein
MLLPAFLLPKGELPLPLRLTAFFGVSFPLYFHLLPLELEGMLGLGSGSNGLSGFPSFPPHSLGVWRASYCPICRNRRAKAQLMPVGKQPIQNLLIPGFAAESDFAHLTAALILPLVKPDPKGRFKIHGETCLGNAHIQLSSFKIVRGEGTTKEAGYWQEGGLPRPDYPTGTVFLSPLGKV